MSAGDEVDRLRAAFAQPDGAHDADGCPSAGEIWDGLHGELPSDRLRQVVDHLITCPACAEAWRLGLLLEDAPGAAIAPGPPAASPLGSVTPLPRPLGHRGPRRRRIFALGAAAAVVAACLVGGLSHYYLGAPPPTRMVQRGGGEEGTVKSTRWLTTDGAVLRRGDAILRWTGPPGATYDLHLYRSDANGAEGSPDAKGDDGDGIPFGGVRRLETGEYQMSAEELAALPHGARLRAVVIAHLADGTTERLFRDFELQ